jgi:hypothetical protein
MINTQAWSWTGIGRKKVKPVEEDVAESFDEILNE